MKGFFDYCPSNFDCVRCQVQLFPNPAFQGYRHFRTYPNARHSLLEDAMNDMAAAVDGCADGFLQRREREAEEKRLAEARAQAQAEAARVAAEKERHEKKRIDDERRAVEKEARRKKNEQKREAKAKAKPKAKGDSVPGSAVGTGSAKSSGKETQDPATPEASSVDVAQDGVTGANDANGVPTGQESPSKSRIASITPAKVEAPTPFKAGEKGPGDEEIKASSTKLLRS